MSFSQRSRTKPVTSTWTKERTIDFIEKYRERELLWRVGSRDYLSKVRREQAYEELLAFVRTFVADANRDTIVAKINNLRSTWRREHKKVTSCESEDGNEVDDKYEPSLFYYYHMRFILNSDLNDTETQDAESQDGEQSNLSTHTTADNNDNDIMSERSFSPVDVKVDLNDNDYESVPTRIITEPVPTTLTATTSSSTTPPAPEEAVPIPTLKTAATPQQPTPELVSIPTPPAPEPVSTLKIAHSQTTTAVAPQRTSNLIPTPTPVERIPMPAAVATAVLEARKRKAQEYDLRKKRRKSYYHQEEGEEEEETEAFRSPRATNQNQNPKWNCSDAVVRGAFAEAAKAELNCFGQMMTHALLGMPRDQMIHAKKMISEIIYEGQLNNLSRSSVFLPSPSTNRNNGAGPLYAYLTSDDSGQYSASTSDI